MTGHTKRNLIRGLIVAALALFIPFFILYTQFLNQPLITEPTGFYYVFPKGAPMQAFIKELEHQGMLKHPFLFKMLIYSKGAGRKIQAGEYYFPVNMTPTEVLNTLVEGKVIQHQITLIEGWTFADVLKEVRSNKNIKNTLSPAVNTQLKLPYKNLEGIFLAETYDFPHGLSDSEFLLWAHKMFQQYLQSEWESRHPDLPYRNPYDAVIAASLIEKETADPKERYLIASVIVNRLRKHMLLQIDPSVVYGLYHKFIPVLSKFDLKIDTVYNTYIHKGLPPTPISLPSRASLHAALHPAKTNYYYFVLKDNGKHYFSSTYKQHRQAVERYRHIKRYKSSFRG